MRNNSLIKKIVFYVEKLPYFGVENLKILEIPSYYLRIALSRLETRGEIVRLKKGFYSSKKFIEKTKIEGKFSYFLEFLTSKIYSPSYLSLEYILYENNILTEIPQNFTLVTKNKTATFSNKLGIFIYHKMKDTLFFGFKIIKNGDFLVYKAEKSKALFDFLYLRKGIILNKEMAQELRLNLENFNRQDKKKLMEYVDLEGSKRMKEVYSFLFK